MFARLKGAMAYPLPCGSRFAKRGATLLLGVAMLALLAIEVSAAPPPPSRNVRDFGVKGDGASTETAAIQGAIDACAVEGGCTLVFPPGRYVTGTLYFRDNITLDLGPGAVLATSGRAEDYTAPALLYGKGVNSIALTGDGEIQAGPVPAPDETTTRNPGSRLLSLLLIENSNGVRVSGVRFLRSPAWTVTLRVVDGAWIEGILIDNAMMAANTSGIVLDSSTRVTIRGVHFRGGGDGITLQTSLVDGIAPLCGNITVSGSTLRSGSTAIKLGTATHGDIRNVLVSDTIIEGSQGGIGIFARDGGTVESVVFANLIVDTAAIHRERAEWPIVVDLKRRDAQAKSGSVAGLRFHGIRVNSSGKVLFSGMTGHPIRDLTVNGMTVQQTLPRDSKKVNARPWKSPLDSVSGEDESATAVLLGYIAGATLQDLRVIWETGNPAPESHALFAHSVDGLVVDRFHARQGKVGGSLSAMQFVSSRDIEVRNSTAPAQTGVWIQVQGIPRQEVFVFGNNASAAYREVVYVK